MANIVFAQQLKKIRSEKGLSQENIATELFISRQAVSRWESGEATPDVNNLVQLSDLLDVDLDYLVLAKESHPAEGAEQQTSSTKRPMNGWEFVAKYWWILLAIGGWLSWFIRTIVSSFR